MAFPEPHLTNIIGIKTFFPLKWVSSGTKRFHEKLDEIL